MRFFFILIFLICSLSNSFGNDEALKTAIKDLSGSSVSPSVDYQAACANCATSRAVNQTAILQSKSNNTKIPLTVLSKKDAEKIFHELASNPNIPFGYPLDGCYARAHKMVQLMEEKGIISGKAWVRGDIYVDSKLGEINWVYHVAPVVLVQEKNGPVPYVIDPSLSKKIIPFSQWKAIMMAKKTSVIEDEYYTNRFAFSPSERISDFKKYDENINQFSDERMKEFLQLQNVLQQDKE